MNDKNIDDKVIADLDEYTEVVEALDGMINVFLRMHDCKTALDCNVYPEYQR